MVRGLPTSKIASCTVCPLLIHRPSAPRRLTFDARGQPNKTNGLAEFIAQEEMDRSEGFWWSNNADFIAYHPS